MKLIVFSDIHGNSYALDKFIEQVNGMTYDYLVFCGDIFGYYYNQKEIIKKLCALVKLIWLKGNHDEYFLNIYKGNTADKYYIQQYGHSYADLAAHYSQKEAELIESHPSGYVLEESFCKTGIFHGTPKNCLEGRLYPDNPIQDSSEYEKYDLVILGHTHCRMLRKTGHTLILNPGSLGQPRDGRGFSFAMADTESKTVQFRTVDINRDLLYHQIDAFDPGLGKLKEVLERRA